MCTPQPTIESDGHPWNKIPTVYRRGVGTEEGRHTSARPSGKEIWKVSIFRADPNVRVFRQNDISVTVTIKKNIVLRKKKLASMVLLTSKSLFMQMAPIPVSSSSNGQAIPVLPKRSPSSPVFFAISTHPSPGNTGLRYFPCSGYLGLTPVRTEGGPFVLFFCHFFGSFPTQWSAQGSRMTKSPFWQNP
jgi:hypothetical protein